MISLDYYALYDAVKSEFEHVRMLGQAPFVGYVIADFAPEGTPEPSLDTAFLPGGAEEPELFIAVASQKPVELEAFAVVQLPYRSVVTGSSGNDTEALHRARAGEQTARSKLTELEGQLATERQAVAARDGKLREAETKVFARDAELLALRQELENKNQLIKAHEANLADLMVSGNRRRRPRPKKPAPRIWPRSSRRWSNAASTSVSWSETCAKAERVGKELVRQAVPSASSDSAAETRRKAAESELAQKLAKSQADLIATRWALEAAVKRGAASAENAES